MHPSDASRADDPPRRAAMQGIPMSGTERSKIRPGVEVQIVQKHHQRSGTLTRGVVQDILTKSATHPHGIKIRLETGEVGRVKEIVVEN